MAHVGAGEHDRTIGDRGASFGLAGIDAQAATQSAATGLEKPLGPPLTWQ